VRLSFRVLTYNIRSGTDMLGRGRLAEQAATVRGAAPDVVLLQEVADSSQAERIARDAGLEFLAYGATRRTRAGAFGNAILSRWPLEDHGSHAVPRRWVPAETRGVVAATLVADNIRVRVIGAHFGLLPGEPELSTRTVLDLAHATAYPVVVGGDFNRPRAAAICHRLLRQALTDCASVDGRIPQASFPSARPLLRLDYLYVRGLGVEEVVVLPSQASDHRPLLAQLDVIN
jgi:endonuclease/exonuclease/phosphatase family metal-dependent hydrolase